MAKIKIKNNILKTLSYTIATTLLLTGCGEESDCIIPTRHVHKYIKQLNNGLTIEKYLDDEHLNVSGYNWQNEYIEINKVDEKVYKLFRSNSLFEGKSNWNYLYNFMASQEDYLKFYYEYTTEEKYTTTDEEGNEVEHIREVEHSGWHTDPYFRENTGKTRLYHHQFYGYKLVYKNDKFQLEESPHVDDIREIINEYPYFRENCATEIYETFYFNRYQLRYLTPDDFDVFEKPDLENPDIDIPKARVKKLKD